MKLEKAVGDGDEDDQAGPNDALLKHDENTLNDQKQMEILV